MPALQDGTVFAFGTMPGMTPQDYDSNEPSMQYDTDVSVTGSQPPNQPQAHVATPRANYVAYLIGIAVFLIVLKFASEHEKYGIDPKIGGIGAWNFVVFGIMAQLWFVGTKVIFNKWQVKGITDIVNAA